jgi:hypothetical protein
VKLQTYSTVLERAVTEKFAAGEKEKNEAPAVWKGEREMESVVMVGQEYDLVPPAMLSELSRSLQEMQRV